MFWIKTLLVSMAALLIAWSSHSLTTISTTPTPTVPSVIITASNADHVIEIGRIWLRNVEQIAWLSGGKTLALASPSGAWLYQVDRPQLPPYLLANDSHGITSVAASPDGTVLATGGADLIVKLWDTKTDKQIGYLFGMTGPQDFVSTFDIAFSPDGRYVIAADPFYSKILALWEVSTGKVQFTYDASGERYLFSPDSTTIAHFYGGCCVPMDLLTVPTATKKPIPAIDTLSISAAAYSHNGAQLAIADAQDSTLRLLDMHTGAVLGISKGHAHPAYNLAFSPDDTLLASGGANNTVLLWDLTGKNRSLALSNRASVWPSDFVFNVDGSLLAIGNTDSTVGLWNTQTGKQLAILVGAGNPNFNSDGSMLATISQGTVRLWAVGH